MDGGELSGLGAVRSGLGEAAFGAAWATGQAMPLEAATGYALADVAQA